MKTLARAVRQGLKVGEPLPMRWTSFEEHRAIWRKGAFHVIAGPPGSQKTITCLNLVDMFGPQVGTVYISPDSDENTMAARVLSMVLKQPTDDMEVWLKQNKGAASKALLAYSHVKWSFHSSPTLDDIYKTLDAYHEVEGRYPDHTVVDVAMAVDHQGTGEMNFWSLFENLKILARDCNTALTVAHHTSESIKGNPCQPREAVMGKANQTPTLILTLAPTEEGRKMNFAVVKNRMGPSDVSGQMYFTMAADPARCRIAEMPREMVA